MKLEESVKTAVGLYTVNEAARYARMHPQTLSNWLYGARGSSALRTAQIPKSEGKFLTFVEFVEALAIRNFRINYNISLQKIREAIEDAKQHYGLDYPFSNRDHKTYRVGRDLHIVLKGSDQLVQLSGKEKGQRSMKPCLEQYMNDLEWDDKNMVAAYTAYQYSARSGNVFIKMRPTVYFGAPIVEGTGHTAETLWQAALAEGSEAKAAEYYEVNVDSVLAACRYCEELKLAA